MSYIGNTPTQQNFVAGADQFSGNGSTTAFTLSRNVNTVFDIFVAISNVPQDPYSAYSVSGNTLTFTSAPPSGTGNIYVVYRATNVQTFVPTPGATVGGSFGVQGNLNFFSTGNRITGDFSNGTLANRVAFQSSTTNGETSLVVIPNGTSTTTRIQLGDASNLSGSGNFLNLFNTGSEVSIRAGTYSGGTGLPMTFYTNGSERMRIDSSGKLLIGTSSSITTNNGESPYTQTSGTDSRWAYQVATFANSSGTQGGLYLAKSRGTSVGSYTAVQSGDSLGRIGWSGADGTNMSSTAAEITAQVDAAVSTGIVPGRLLFFTSNTSGTLTERMRIDSSGNLLVGKTTTSSTTAGINLGANPNFIANTPSPSDGPYIQIGNIASSVASGFRYVSFRVNAGGGEVGSISTNGSSTTSYNTSSDYRLKENVQPMTGALAKVAALKPCVYTWKVDGSAGEGFIAHELAEVVPDAVTGEKDAVNEDGSIKPQGIDTSFLVATLTAAIQELNAKVEAQAAEIAALKGAA